MSDILEVTVIEQPFEVVFDDASLEVLIQEDNLDIAVSNPDTEVVILNEDVSILTIAEQGPPGVGGGSGGLFPMSVGITPPSNPSIGDLWLDMN